MTYDDFLYGCSIFGLVPPKYDEGGWYTLVNKLGKVGVDVTELDDLSALPKSRKDAELKITEYKNKIQKLDSFTCVTGINADTFWQLSEEKRDKEFKHFVETIEHLAFPPCILETDPILQQYIVDHYMYTFASDGSPIVYCRALGVPGTIWEECGDSEDVFLKARGELREGLIKRLVVRSLARTYTVFYMKDGEQNIMEHVPYWKLHKKYYSKAMESVKGSPENVTKFAEKYTSWIDYIKQCNAGKLSDGQLERGMQEIPKMLRELDSSLLDMTFFYHKNIDLPTLTNDPSEPAMAYFDLSAITEGPTPDFDGFMEAVEPDCRKALMAAIYATFFAKCRLNQYIWIHGEGGDGKSSLLNAIATYAGDRLACSLGQTMNSDFGLEDAIGKRMVILSDVKTGLSVKSQLIHNLTGHDPVSVNRKNKPIITVRLNPIVWIAANEAPDVNFDNRNEARRCLYIKMCEPPEHIQKKFYFTDENGNFILDNAGRKMNNGYDLEGGLLREMPHILYKCREAFEQVCPPPYSVIKPEIGALQMAEDNCVDLEAATYSTYIVETFSFDNKNAQLLQTEVFEAIQETMKNHSDRNNLNQFAKRDIRRLLTVKYGCKRKKINGIYYMEGITRKVNGFSPIPNPDTGRPVYMPPQLDIKLPEDNTEFL